MTTLKSLSTFLTLAFAINLGAQNILVSRDSANMPDVELGEVVIAASRDNSKIKDIPSAITSISGVQIERNQINSLEDIAAFAPNFMMLDYGTKYISPIYIRGVGSKKNSPSIGMNVDGIPYYDNSSLSFDFYDLQSLEILRGPQGTLYGRNTIGGLININTLSPLDYQGTNIKLSAAQYDNYQATASHYGESGKLAYSLAGNFTHNGGYFTNAYDSS
ncbi:MAG: TonB-dependent receptor plug domain-containing protein, partial [Bacteroidales bacterium]|nr:TonB-dependent receptor plug domain-containing protein [Bacteroidales bacterium]